MRMRHPMVWIPGTIAIAAKDTEIYSSLIAVHVCGLGGGGGWLCEAEYFFLPIKLVSVHSKGSPYCLLLELEVCVRPCLYACVSVVCACVRVCMYVSSTAPQYYCTCRHLRCVRACVYACTCVDTGGVCVSARMWILEAKSENRCRRCLLF